jgi:toxin ParE1/3/4
MSVILSALAEQDLESIADYIAVDSPTRAESFVDELLVQCQRIAQNPLGYRLRPELLEGVRSCAYGNYVIFFDVDAEDIVVVRILHGARDFPTVFQGGEH